MSTLLLIVYFIGAGYTTDHNYQQATGMHAVPYWSEQRQIAEKDMGLYQNERGEWDFKVDDAAVEADRAALALRDVRVGQIVSAYGIVGFFEGRAADNMASVRFQEGTAKVRATDITIVK